MDPASHGSLPLTDDAVRLAGQLAAALTDDQRLVLFTGTMARQGVSTVAAQVALAFARMRRERILLLDANTQAPTVHKRFHIPPAPGLAEVLEGKVEVDMALSRGEATNLWLLPLGRGDADFVHLLGSEACPKLLQLMRQRFRLVVIDAAPLLHSAPTSLFASRSDGVVTVVAAGLGHRADLIELKRVLKGLKVSLLGAVLTTADLPAPTPPTLASLDGRLAEPSSLSTSGAGRSGNPEVAPTGRPPRRITVVHVLHTIAYGGVETIVINWLRALDPERFEAHVVCFSNPGGTEAPFVGAAHRAGLEVRTIRWARRKPILGAARELARILRAVKADVVHTHNVYADLVGLVAAKLAGVRAVSSLFVWSDFGWKRNLLQRIDQWALRHFDLITTQCEDTRQDTIARGLPPERTRVLISGFETPPPGLEPAERARHRRALGIEDGQVVLANVARLYPEKAQDLLLRCFATLRERHPEARLWIFGTGPLEAPLRSLCSRLGLDGQVRFTGFVDDLMASLPLLDVQVHPSHAEGVPMALCSGLAAGLPVVASAVGGVPEVLDGGRCGLLVPPAGDPAFTDEFLAAISRLLTDPEERHRLGGEGRRFMETTYSLKSAVHELERTYSELVGACG